MEMYIGKKEMLIILAIIITILIAIFLGVNFGKLGYDYETIADGIIIENKFDNYDSMLIKNYDEYIELLKKYKINEQVFLTNGDLEENDYIVDFINYDNTLKIYNINLEFTDNGINLEYEINKEINNNSKKLIYFIPINKNSITDYKLNNREFIVK